MDRMVKNSPTSATSSVAHDFTGRRVLITGGSRGIGASIAQRLLDAGASVVTTARSATTTTPDGAQFVTGDVATVDGVQAIADASWSASAAST